MSWEKEVPAAQAARLARHGQAGAIPGDAAVTLQQALAAFRAEFPALRFDWDPRHGEIVASDSFGAEIASGPRAELLEKLRGRVAAGHAPSPGPGKPRCIP